jgi:hypothetical protein
MTVTKGLSKKKSIVSIARRLAEMMYSLLRTKEDYEVRPWSGSLKASMAEQALSA